MFFWTLELQEYNVTVYVRYFIFIHALMKVAVNMVTKMVYILSELASIIIEKFQQWMNDGAGLETVQTVLTVLLG